MSRNTQVSRWPHFVLGSRGTASLSRRGWRAAIAAYVESDIAVVKEIVRLHSSGLALPSAIRSVTNTIGALEHSLFSALRRRHPGVQRRVLRKRTLLGVTRAMGDDCCTRAAHPLLFAGFQRERFYRESQDRWVELARTAEAAFAFADFARHSAVNERPVRLALPKTAGRRREWLLVCDDPEQSVCVVGSEPPGQSGITDRNRRFETLWMLDPLVVRDFARVCARLGTSLKPPLSSRLDDRLAGGAREGSTDLRRTQALTVRIVDYFDAV